MPPLPRPEHENRPSKTWFIAQNRVSLTQDVSKKYSFEIETINYIVWKMGSIPNFGLYLYLCALFFSSLSLSPKFMSCGQLWNKFLHENFLLLARTSLFSNTGQQSVKANLKVRYLFLKCMVKKNWVLNIGEVLGWQ